MAYVYTDKTLQSEHWPEPARAAALWERAESAERRMLEHHCTEEGN